MSRTASSSEGGNSDRKNTRNEERAQQRETFRSSLLDYIGNSRFEQQISRLILPVANLDLSVAVPNAYMFADRLVAENISTWMVLGDTPNRQYQWEGILFTKNEVDAQVLQDQIGRAWNELTGADRDVVSIELLRELDHKGENDAPGLMSKINAIIHRTMRRLRRVPLQVPHRVVCAGEPLQELWTAAFGAQGFRRGFNLYCYLRNRKALPKLEVERPCNVCGNDVDSEDPRTEYCPRHRTPAARARHNRKMKRNGTPGKALPEERPTPSTN